MAEYLVIRLGSAAEDPAQWIAVNADGSRIGPPMTGTLNAASADATDRRVLVLVPGADVLTTTVDIPVKGAARLQAALPYAMEEALAEDIDNLHFAAGSRRDNGQIPVSVVSQARMDGWLEQLAAASIRPSKIIAEQYGLARIPGTISMLLDGEQLYVNDGVDTEFLMQDVTPGDALVAIGALNETATSDDDEEQVAPPAHLLVYCEPADDERYRHDWMALRNELASVDVKLLPDGVLPQLAATAATGVGVNLLQGAYGPKKEYSGIVAQWKYAAMLLLSLLVVGTVAKGVDYRALVNEEAALREQFLTEYQTIAPGVTDVEDPTRLVASLRARAGGGNTAPQLLLQALEQISAALRQNEDASIEAITFRAGVADIRLNAASVSVLDGIRQNIDRGGNFRATIQSTDPVGDRVNSRLQIQVASK